MEINKIFAIFDPTSNNERLLDVLKRIAGRESAEVTAYCCIYSAQRNHDQAMMIRIEKQRFTLWLNKILQPLIDEGIKVKKKIQWHPSWRDAAVETAGSCGCDLIVKNSYSQDSDRFAKTIDRVFLRNSKVPVLFLRRKSTAQTGVLLAAIKSQDLDTKHKKVNDMIMDFSHALAKNNPELKVNVVTAYSGSDHFIYPEDLAKQIGLDHKQVHAVDGSPVFAVQKAAKKTKAELVVLGSVARKGVAQRLLGSTAEQLLDQLDADIIAMIDRR